MNPAYFYTWTAKSSPLRGIDGEAYPQLFDLELCLRPGGEPIRYFRVHIPQTLQAALADGAVKGIHIETINIDSLASRVLPADPMYIILGLITQAGERLTELPKSLQRARQFCMAAGTVLTALGIAALLTEHAWAGALAVVFGTHFWRTAAQMPREACLKHTDPPVPAFKKLEKRPA